MEYVTPVNGDANDPTRPYQDGDPSLGQVGSIPSARFFNLLMNEGRNLVEGAGLTLDPQDDAQWLAAIAAIVSASGEKVVKRDTIIQASTHTTSGSGVVTIDNCDLEYAAIDGANPRLIEARLNADAKDNIQGGNLAFYRLQYFVEVAGTWQTLDIVNFAVAIVGATEVRLRSGIYLRALHTVNDPNPRYRLAHHTVDSGDEVSSVSNAQLYVTEYSV